MRKTIMVTGLDCPICAETLEKILRGTAGITDAKVSYPLGKIDVEYEEDSALERAIRAINSFEEVRVADEKNTSTTNKSTERKQSIFRWIRMCVSALLLAVAILVSGLDGVAPMVISYTLYGIAYLTVAYPILLSTLKNIRKSNIFDENFLMSVASIGAFCLGEFWEGVLVMLLYELGETLQSIAVGSSRKSIASLMELKTDYATRMVEGGAETVTPEQLNVGDKILVKAGDKIPCDSILLSASAVLDVKSLTGESNLQRRTSGEELLAGSINAGEPFIAKIARTYENSAVAKILTLVEHSIESKAPTEKFITKFSKVYTPLVCMLAVCIALFPPIITGIAQGTYAYANGKQWIETALTFLVISCPCALVISVPLTYFVGIGKCAKEGILVKGAANLDVVAKTKVAALDKTGTLTKGNFSIIGAYPEGITQDELLSVCAALEEYSAHPIAGAFAHLHVMDRATGVKEFVGKGMKGEYLGKTAVFGTLAFVREQGFDSEERFSADTVLYLIYDGKYCGCLEIGDVIREESKALLADLEGMGIHTVMLTGDSPARAQKVANAIGMSAFKAGLLPDEKVVVVEKLKEKGCVLYAGDGINDAPVMAAADCAVSMGSLGSAAAVEASDFVLISDELSAIPHLIKTAQKTRKIVLQNVVFSIMMKSAFLLVGLFPWFALWMGVFADVGVMLIAVLNSLRVRR